MPYNLTPLDIYNSFAKAISGDFASLYDDAETIVNDEIAFQAEKLSAMLPTRTLSMLVSIDLEIVDVDALYQFQTGLNSIISSVRAWKIDKCAIPCKTCDYFVESNEIEISWISEWKFETVDKTWDREKYMIVVSYDIDEATQDYGLFKSILRHMVCAALGYKLFPTIDGDVWSIVKYHKEESDKYLEMIGKYLPKDWKRLKLLNPPVPIVGINARRY